MSDPIPDFLEALYASQTPEARPTGAATEAPIDVGAKAPDEGPGADPHDQADVSLPGPATDRQATPEPPQLPLPFDEADTGPDDGWVLRPGARGRLGWEPADLPEAKRWWAHEQSTGRRSSCASSFTRINWRNGSR
jgi:hypothetical protein